MVMTQECIEKKQALLARLAPYAPLSLRLVIGIIFFAHGGQKLFGMFGGGGFADTAHGFSGLLGGAIPGTVLAALGGGGEFFGGIFVLLGLFTRFGGFLLACTMLVAILAVHFPNGLFASNNGFEYPLSLLAVAVSLMISGAGPISLDRVLKLPCR